MTVTERILKVLVSPRFAAMLDFIYSNPQPRTDNRITSMSITSDGWVMIWTTDRPDKEGLAGNKSDLYANLDGLFDVLKLTKEERREAMVIFKQRVMDWSEQ